MAVTAFLYGKSSNSLANKEINLGSDTIKVMLCTATYAPAQDTHQYKSSVTNEITGTGYTAGGAALTSVVVSYATKVMTFTAANTSWASATFTARYAVVYDSTPATDATRPLICWIDFGVDTTVTAATFTITWDALGIATWTVA